MTPDEIDAVVFDMGGVFTIQHPVTIGRIVAREGVELELEFRPIADTLRDAIRWQYEAGHLKARSVGKLA